MPPIHPTNPHDLASAPLPSPAATPTPSSVVRDRIRDVSPDVMTTFERIEARRGSPLLDAELFAVSCTQEFADEYRRVSGQSLGEHETPQ